MHERAGGDYAAIVVAGCRVDADGRAGPALAARTDAAVRLWRDGLAPALVFTGGSEGAVATEARAAANRAEAAGVPVDVMILEERSTSTEGNALYSRELVQGRVLVVTDAYHVFRSERVWGRHFDEAEVVGVEGPTTARIKGALREVAAVGWYAVTGRL